MITFIAGKNKTNQKMLGVGLSRKNIEYLLENKIIVIDKDKLGIPLHNLTEIVVFFGETESKMMEMLDKYNLLSGTVVKGRTQ